MGEVAPGLIAWGVDEIKWNNSKVIVYPKVEKESENPKYVNGLPKMLVSELKKFKKKMTITNLFLQKQTSILAKSKLN